MKIEQSVQRIQWRLASKKPFTANLSDIEALNDIIEYVDKKQNEQYDKNENFAKLYIRVYGKMIQHYKATVFDLEPKKAMMSIFRKSLPETVDDFKNQLNNSELCGLLEESYSGEPKHPLLRKGIEHDIFEDETENLSEKIKKDPEAMKKIKREVFDYDTVYNNLKAEISNVINSF